MHFMWVFIYVWICYTLCVCNLICVYVCACNFICVYACVRMHIHACVRMCVHGFTAGVFLRCQYIRSNDIFDELIRRAPTTAPLTATMVGANKG